MTINNAYGTSACRKTVFLQDVAERCEQLNGPFVKCSGVLTDFCLARFVGRHMRLHRTSGCLKNSIRAPERPIIVIVNSCVGTRDSEMCRLGVR